MFVLLTSGRGGRGAAAALCGAAAEELRGAERPRSGGKEVGVCASHDIIIRWDRYYGEIFVLLRSNGSGSDPGSDEALQRRLLDLEQNFNFPRSALAVQLSTARAGLSHCPEARAFLEADWPIRAQRCPRREARFQVFRDLRGRGFFLTSAGKFGGDFLVYPGEPEHPTSV